MAPGDTVMVIAKNSMHRGRHATVQKIHDPPKGECIVRLGFGDGSTGAWMLSEVRLVREAKHEAEETE